MSDAETTRVRSAPVVFAAGVAAGVVVTALVAVLAWPDSADETDGAQGASDVATPIVPPAPTAGESISGEEGTPSPSADDDSKDDSKDDKNEEPSEAALVTGAAPAGKGPLPNSTAVTCPAATTTVSGSTELESALAAAEPGESIQLEDGTYRGQFAALVSGTAQQPIFLCGSAGAVLDGGDVDESGYTMHLDGASYWRLVGFTIQGGQKGLVADTTVGSVIQDLTVTGTGDEAIHLRDNSTDNLVLDNTVSDTGLSNEKYGEGIYLGSAVSNWCTYSDCEADRSDRNVVKGNAISATTSEAIDVKEGTTGGAILDNTFDGSRLSGADSWVDIKGNNYLIEGNVGTSSAEDGFQTHQILDGWGDFNVFSGNSADVGGDGYAIASQPPESNVVLCNNTFVAAAEGLSNIDCS